ncbi:MAG TPA: SE1832 family protein [Pseudogracilibacillus sp.]|nr:SE1832 family protein [Pseudogracilibacillus sp.]
MTKKELEAKLAELKSDYVRVQSDLEKVVFVGGREESPEQELIRLEEEIAKVNAQLDELNK